MQHYKHFIIGCLTLFFSGTAFSQSEPVDMTGLWTGMMFNDTTELNYRYEIAISEKKGKLIGYSQTFFILEGKEYYGVKKIKITIDGNKVITQDLKLIENNYPATVKIPKGVYVMNVLNFEKKNDVMMLSGMFETNRTHKYAPATGYVHLERKIDVLRSPLVKQLEKMGLKDELSFVEEEKIKALAGDVRTEVTTVQKNTGSGNTLIQNETPGKIIQNDPVLTKTEAPKTQEIKPGQQPQKEETIIVSQKPSQAAADINNRLIETIQSVNYASDSLVLSLYDNGEIDGDTVSVLLNGNVVMPKVGLSTNAVRKTIYTKDLPDTIQLVMYAETLGSLPPNTGLLIVYDGTERYEIRFSGDLKKNAAIVFRRKQK